jgi:hypothetical protein
MKNCGNNNLIEKILNQNKGDFIGCRSPFIIRPRIEKPLNTIKTQSPDWL